MPRIIYLILLIGILAPLHGAEAFWWLFRKSPVDMPPQEQTRLAQPIFESAQQAEVRGSKGSAARQYRRVFRRYPAANTAGQSLFNYGVIQYNRAKLKHSFEAFQQLLAFHPDFPRFTEVLNYQYSIAMRAAEGDGMRMLLVFPYRAHNQSVGYFELVIRNAPYGDLAPLALMNVALIHQYKNNTIQAIDALDRLINNYPTSLLASDAYLNLAETFSGLVDGPDYDQGATREAMSYFEDFMILYSDHEEVARAEAGLQEMEDVYARSKLVIGQFYYRYRRWYDAAEIFFNEAITVAPESEAAATAREFLVRVETDRAARDAARASGDSQRERNFIQRLLRRGSSQLNPGSVPATVDEEVVSFDESLLASR
jgi:outer membrane protein assembly factor BamD